MSNSDLFLEVASRIGHRIVKQARWNNGSCTWEIMQPDRQSPQLRRSVGAMAPGTVYQGTAGIALFLIELYQATGDPASAQCAEGAIKHALGHGRELPDNSFGFHTGRVGIAFAATRAGIVLGKSEQFREAETLLSPLRGNECRDNGLDIVGGAAGAIPALLGLADTLNQDLVIPMAIALGDHLIEIAHREPNGWSWGSPGPSPNVRHLTGFAHGAAGIGHGLLTLHDATALGNFRYAAEQAFLYEKQFFNPREFNWQNLRHLELGEYLYGHRLGELRTLLRKGEKIPPYRPACMSAWCHGAPGIALARLRAYELTADPLYAKEAQAALRATQKSVRESLGNYSLCHGDGGNCEALLRGTDVLGDSSLRQLAEECGIRGWDDYEKPQLPWPCGTLGEVTDPSLLMGEAGIGYFYLRLHRNDIPSVLQLPVRLSINRAALETQSYGDVQDEYIRGFFDRTLRVIEKLDGAKQSIAIRSCSGSPAESSDVIAIFESIQKRVEKEGDACVRDLIRDAFGPERARYQMALSPNDYCGEFLAELERPDPSEIAWGEVLLRLSPSVRLVQSQWDWDQWLADAQSAGHPTPAMSGVTHLVYQAGCRVVMKRVSSLAAFVLTHLQDPVTLDQIVESVRQHLCSKDTLSSAVLAQKVVDQLKAAFRAGLLSSTSITASSTISRCAVVCPTESRSQPPHVH